MSKRFVSIGEALVDSIRRDGSDSVQDVVGGSLLNVAAGAAQLGLDAELATWFARDERGRRIAQFAVENGVRLVPGSDAATSTTVAHANLDADGRATYEFDVEWDVPDIPEAETISHLHTGSYAATLEPGADRVFSYIQQQSDIGTISYDPNVRPALMGAADVVLGRVEGIVALSDVVKASDEDIEWLYPGISVEQTMRAWIAAGVAMVVVTRGPWGSYVMVAAERDMLVVDPLSVQVHDTVGAGDSFMAGLITGLMESDLLGSIEARQRLREAKFADVQPALRQAIAASGLTVSREGAYSPTRDEVDAVIVKALFEKQDRGARCG